MRSILIYIAFLAFQVNSLKNQVHDGQEYFLGQNQPECEDDGLNDTNILIPAIQLASSSNFEFYSHKWVNLICWGFLIDFGIIIVRLGKRCPNWIEYHGLFMGILVLSSAIVEFEMIIQNDIPQNLETNPNVGNIHSVIGFIFLGLIGVQCLGGIFLRYSIYQSEIINNLKLRSRFHCYGGHLIYLTGKIQAALGVYTIYNESNDASLIISMWSLYFFFFFWRILVESLYSKGYLNFILFSKRDSLENVNNKSASADMLTGYITTHDQNMLETEFNTKTWVLFNNSIINLTGLIHPGGQFIWQAVKGREVSRFIYGAYGLENSEIPAYNHSQYALEMIKFLTIGAINPIPFYIFKENESEMFGQPEQRQKWLLSSIDQLSERVSRFRFANLNIEIRSTLSGLNAMGRYFLLQSTNNSLPVRPYTMVLCMADESKVFREQLINFLDSQEVPLEMTPKLSSLPLLIKKYDTNNGLSQYVHTHLNEEYYIEGPYGTSLGLPEHGKIVLVCGGTGLFPVLDLLDYFLKKTVYELLLQQYGQKVAQQSNANGYDFQNTLHLTLFLAVADESELIGKDIYLNLLKFQKQLQQPMFRMILKIRKPIPEVECVTERFNEAFFQKYLINVTEYVRFIVCGPPFMNREVPLILQSLGVLESNIHLL